MPQHETRRVDPTLKATLAGGVGISGSIGLASVDATLEGVGAAPRLHIALDETLDGEAIAQSASGANSRGVGRTTVLPRRKSGVAQQRPTDERARFERVRLLGEGA